MSEHTLLLVRHAKAAPGDDGPDHDRPLTGRGRADAAALGELLADRDLVPHLVLCSDAVRAEQTWQQAASRLPAPVPVRPEQRLYQASPEGVLHVVGEVDEDVATLAVVGHEPVTSALALALAGEGSDPAELARLRTGLPTAAVAVLRTASPWRELAGGAAALTGLLRPRG